MEKFLASNKERCGSAVACLGPVQAAFAEALRYSRGRLEKKA